MEPEVWLCAAVFIIIILFLVNVALYKHKVDQLSKNVPKLDLYEWPIVGHLPHVAFRINSPEDAYKVIQSFIDPITEDRRFWAFNIHFFVAVTLNTIEKILLSQEAVEKSYMHSFFDVLVAGAYSAPTERWRGMRKRSNLTFNPKFFEQYIIQMNYHADTFVGKVESLGITKDYVDVHQSVSRYIFDSLTTTHLGVNTKMQLCKANSVADEMSKSVSMVYKRVFQPWLHPEFMFVRSKLGQEMIKTRKSYDQYISNVALASEEYQHKLDISDENINKKGWKSYIVHLKEVYGQMGLKTDPNTMGVAAADLMVAGADTASIAVSAALYHLGLNPHYQERAYQEIMNVIDEDPGFHDETSATNDAEEVPTIQEGWEFPKRSNIGGKSCWTKSQLDKLEFVEMLVKEGMRVASVPLIVRCPKSNLDMGDFIIPKGTNILVMLRSLHKSPEYFDKPEEFYPEHFSKENVKRRPKLAFIPFAHGPRDCPAKTYAIYIMKCLLAEIIRNYTIITKPSNGPIEYKFVIMIEHSKGYPIKLVPRG